MAVHERPPARRRDSLRSGRSVALAVGLVAPSILLALFGSAVETNLLRPRFRIYAHTQFSPPDEAFRGSMGLGTRPTAGVLWHELVHMQARVGTLARDVPTAAAFQLCLNARLGTIADTAGHELMRRVWRATSRSGFLKPRGGELVARLDALLIRDSIQVERVPATYRNAATLAGLALALTGTEAGCEDLISFLMLGASTGTSLRAVREPEVEMWLRSLYFAEPYEMLDRSYRMLAERGDTTLILEGFNILAARAARDSARSAEFARYLDVAWHRYADPDTIRIWQLGSRTRIRRTSTDSASSRVGPLVWLNTRTFDNRVGEISEDLKVYVENQVAAWFGWPMDAVRTRVVVEPGRRNLLTEGVIMLQWSPLLPVEAETALLIANGTILGALITVNSHVTELGVVGQEIGHASGLLGHVKPGTIESLMQNPLPRPRAAFDNPSYRHFLAQFDVPSAESGSGTRDGGSEEESGLGIFREHPLSESAEGLSGGESHYLEGIVIARESPTGRFSPEDLEFIRATMLDESLMPRVLRSHLGGSQDSPSPKEPR